MPSPPATRRGWRTGACAATPARANASSPRDSAGCASCAPREALGCARRIALAEGLRHVYVGNVHDVGRQSTWCAGCGELLIERDWHRLGKWHLDEATRCTHCGTPCAGYAPGDGRGYAACASALS